VLYGPTNPNETHFYGRAEVLYPETDATCIPCLDPACNQNTCCMDFISSEAVMSAVERLLTQGNHGLTDC